MHGAQALCVRKLGAPRNDRRNCTKHACRRGRRSLEGGLCLISTPRRVVQSCWGAVHLTRRSQLTKKKMCWIKMCHDGLGSIGYIISRLDTIERRMGAIEGLLAQIAESSSTSWFRSWVWSPVKALPPPYLWKLWKSNFWFGNRVKPNLKTKPTLGKSWNETIRTVS